MSSLMGILYNGVSGLFAAQAGIDVTGTNLNNMKTEGYSKQTVKLSSMPPQVMGNLVFGRGVIVSDIQRNYDDLLYKSYLGEKTSFSYFSTMQSSIQTSMVYFNELEAGSGLGDSLKNYFNAWSDLSSTASGDSTADATTKRLTLVEKTQTLSMKIREGYQSILDVQSGSDKNIANNVSELNTMLQNIAQLNTQITSAEAGGGSANNLRDARDLLISKMADKANVNIFEKPNGQVTVSLGGQTVVEGSTAYQLQANRNPENNNHISVYLKVPNSNSAPVNIDSSITSGIIGAELKSRDMLMPKYLKELDALAKNLITETNRLHSTGQGMKRYSQITGTNSVMNSLYPLSSDSGKLPSTISKGSFTIDIYNSKGETTGTVSIDVDPDVDTFANIVNKINTQSGGNLSANLNDDGQIQISLTNPGGTDEPNTFSFVDDTSGFLPAAGLNNFFKGSSAKDIDLSDFIASNSQYIATGKSSASGDNSNALIIAGLQKTSIGGANGTTIDSFYANFIGMMSSDKAQTDTFAATKKMSYGQVATRLESVRGVSESEELVNMTLFQKTFEANSRFINVVDEMLNTIVNGLGAGR